MSTEEMTWDDAFAEYVQDPSNEEYAKSVLKHPDYSVEKLVSAFLNDHPALAGEIPGGEEILWHIAEDIPPELWLKLVTYHGRDGHIRQLLTRYEFETILIKWLKLDDTTWAMQKELLSPLLTADEVDAEIGVEMMEKIRDYINWPAHVADVLNLVNTSSQIASDDDWHGWQQFLQLACQKPN